MHYERQCEAYCSEKALCNVILLSKFLTMQLAIVRDSDFVTSLLCTLLPACQDGLQACMQVDCGVQHTCKDAY